MKTKYIPFFSQRQKLTSQSHARSLRYVSLIRLWKWLLPLGAVLSLAVVFGWSCLEEYLDVFASPYSINHKRMPDIPITNQLVNPRLSTRDGKGRPVNVQAESAIQTSGQAADMTNPESEIILDDGKSLRMQSNKGYYDQKENILRCNDCVELENSDGMKLKTSVANIDLKKNEAEGHFHVTGEGPTGTLEGDGFRVLKEGNELHLLGKSKMTINTGKKIQSSSDNQKGKAIKKDGAEKPSSADRGGKGV